jgi:hypothetical protein
MRSGRFVASRFWKKDRGFAGEIGAGGGGREPGLVVEEDFALPGVRLDAEDGIGKEEDRDFSLPFWADIGGSIPKIA